MPRPYAVSLLAALCMAGTASAAGALEWAAVFRQPASGYLGYTATYQDPHGAVHTVAVERTGAGRVRRVTDGVLEVDYQPDAREGGRYRVVDHARRRVYQGSEQSMHRIGMLASSTGLDGRPAEPKSYKLTRTGVIPMELAGWRCDWYRVAPPVPAPAAVDDICWSLPLGLALRILRTKPTGAVEVLWSAQQVGTDPAELPVPQLPTAGYSMLDLDVDAGAAAD